MNSYTESCWWATGAAEKFSWRNTFSLADAITVPHEEVVLLVRGRQLHGRGIGWIDAHLLASALADRLQLWTADEPLAAVADELGVGHRV